MTPGSPGIGPGNTEVDVLLADAEVLIVVGPGGVGKTTLAAALGARAARFHDRRVLVVTVDPARRLADALGVADMAEQTVTVPVGPGAGRLWALMVDMGQSWDRIISRHAPDDRTRTALLKNRLYRTLTQKFVQSHDYIALDRLVDLVDDDSYDLVVIDTPPSAHALDVLDAPDRMIEFFGNRTLTWLTAPYRNRLVRVAATPFLAIAERLLGGVFLAEIANFFWLFARLQPDFVRRARQVKATLDRPSTRYVVVQTVDSRPATRAFELGRSLADRGHQPALVLVNRSPDQSLGSIDAESVATIVDPGLRAAVDAVVTHARSTLPPWEPVPVQIVPEARSGLDRIDDLIALLGPEPG